MTLLGTLGLVIWGGAATVAGLIADELTYR